MSRRATSFLGTAFCRLSVASDNERASEVTTLRRYRPTNLFIIIVIIIIFYFFIPQVVWIPGIKNYKLKANITGG